MQCALKRRAMFATLANGPSIPVAFILALQLSNSSRLHLGGSATLWPGPAEQHDDDNQQTVVERWHGKEIQAVRRNYEERVIFGQVRLPRNSMPTHRYRAEFFLVGM